MQDAYSAADLVVSRAGASTVAELTALGLPCVLVPLPFATSGHQEANARVLEKSGAAKVVLQNVAGGRSAITDSSFPDRLRDALESLLDDAGARANASEAARCIGRPDATAALASLVLAASH
jgi:UDP-N-acetylglucosamine--N-acetylmuramyl-(pentapeptide) pyrophosphoryl-undecaprenol N-acetylglucosamine transferase